MNNIIISKEEFCKIMKQIEMQRKKTEKFSEALDEICDGFPVFDANNQYFSALIFLLNKTFNLKETSIGTTLEWFLFEGTGENSQTHKMSFEGYEVNIDSYEKLYDLLLSEKSYEEDNNPVPTIEFFKKYGTKKEGEV